MEPQPPACSEPQLASLADAYLEGSLSPEERQAFEQHYFRCEACLHELQLRQALPTALARVGGRRRGKRVWLAAAGLAATGVLGVLFFVPFGTERGPSMAVIVLDGTLRSGEEAVPSAAVGRPIDLRMRVPGPDAPEVRYSVRVMDPMGGIAFSADGLTPSARNEVRVTLPGLPRFGRYEVVLEQHVPGDEAFLHHFAFDVSESG